ncbi:hypothetical protein C1H76_1549 [Elsinoe australis]|uniref:Uncharacterized protein n=1 Tax=Elsinoe australis TaxID=40998 RepID=A0A4U7BB15_9PEZI|nr:hypothetical protein C1H76_1549 [Elsinoe australis]
MSEAVEIEKEELASLASDISSDTRAVSPLFCDDRYDTSSQQSCSDSASSITSEDSDSDPDPDDIPEITYASGLPLRSAQHESTPFRNAYTSVELEADLAVLQIEENAPCGILSDDRFTEGNPPTIGQCKFLIRALKPDEYDLLTRNLGIQGETNDMVADELTRYPYLVNHMIQKRQPMKLKDEDGFVLAQGPHEVKFGLERQFGDFGNIMIGEWIWFSGMLHPQVKRYIRKEARLKLGRWSAEKTLEKGEIVNDLKANVFDVIRHDPTWMNDLKHLFWSPQHKHQLDNDIEVEWMMLLTPPDIDEDTTWPIEPFKWDRRSRWDSTTMLAAFLETIPLILSIEKNRYKTFGLTLIHFWQNFQTRSIDTCTIQLNKIRFFAQFPRIDYPKGEEVVLLDDDGESWGIKVTALGRIENGTASVPTEPAVKPAMEAATGGGTIDEDRMDIDVSTGLESGLDEGQEARCEGVTVGTGKMEMGGGDGLNGEEEAQCITQSHMAFPHIMTE